MIAYLIPGFVALCGAGTFSPAVQGWLVGGPGPTIGGFLYVTLASIAAGMTVSAVRWAVVDLAHSLTGLQRPAWDDAKLAANLAAVEYLVETHYRYYQFYANSFVALLFAFVAWRMSVGQGLTGPLWPEAGVLFVEAVFLAGSRDSLRKYYQRMSALLGSKESEVSDDERRMSRRRRGESECEAEQEDREGIEEAG